MKRYRKHKGSLRLHGGGSRYFRRLTSAPSQLFRWKVYHGPSSLQPNLKRYRSAGPWILPTFAARSAPHQNAPAFNPAAPITINCEFMDQNAPATPHDAPPQPAKHISIGNSDGVGSIFSQLASNPFFTAVGRAALLFLEASSELNISTTIGIWLSRPCSCCARRPEKPQTGRRPASTSHAC